MHIAKCACWVFLLCIPRIPFFLWEQAGSWAFRHPPYLAALSQGRFLTEHLAGTPDPWTPAMGSWPQNYTWISRTIHHSAFLAWADSSRKEHLVQAGLSESLPQKVKWKANRQPGSCWNWAAFKVAPKDPVFSGCQDSSCVDARFPEAPQLSVSFDSLILAPVYEVLGFVYISKHCCCWETKDLYLISARRTYSSMLTVSEGILRDFCLLYKWQLLKGEVKMPQLILLPIYSECGIKLCEVFWCSQTEGRRLWQMQ